jgi:biopolymer transport protein TolR
MRARRKPMNQINVVPFIDVMLVLLIIFMVAAPLIQTGEVKLPTVGQGLAAPTQPIEVTLRKDLTLGVQDTQAGGAPGNSKLNRAQAVNAVKSLQKGADRAVVISADKSVSHGDVMALLSALQGAGIARVGFMAQQSAEGVAESKP